MPHLKSTSQQGTCNELLVELECLRRGWQVFRPSRPDGEVDLLVINESGQIHGIQIRGACLEGLRERKTMGRVRLRIRLRRSNAQRYSKLVTIFIAVRENRLWIFPAEQHKTYRLNFSERSSKYENAWHFIGEAQSNLLVKREEAQLSLVEP